MDIAISTHALREEGDVWALTAYPQGWEISTHALREEGDGLAGVSLKGSFEFLPTPSARRATSSVGTQNNKQAAISTHALREEGDHGMPPAPPCRATFLPTPSARRATRCPSSDLVELAIFLPTPSARRATKILEVSRGPVKFLPTPSARRATGETFAATAYARISTHALREEGDSPPSGNNRFII